MANRISIAAQARDSNMTPRALRRADIVPAVIYGRAFTPRSLQAPYRSIAQVVRLAGTNRLVDLSIEGEDDGETVLIREVQRDPVTSRILHVDFYRIVSGQRIRSSVPLVQHGKAPVTEEGGMVTQLVAALEIECLPRHLPEFLPIDISRLVSFGSRLRVADLAVPPEVTVLTSENVEVARVARPRKLAEAEVEEPPELELGVPAEEGAVREEGPAEAPSDASVQA